MFKSYFQQLLRFVVLAVYLCSICFFTASLYAQEEASYWFFGNGAALHFNASTAPNSIPAPDDFSQYEGCASWSDAEGNLIFFTNGIDIWDANLDIMANGTGLYGHYSAAQSAIVVPQPCNRPIYYVFTNNGRTDHIPPFRGVHYSIVDKSLNGGLGAVTQKNVPVLPNASEQLTAVLHCNGIDYWVLIHEWQSSAFHAYLLDGNGLSETPIVSEIGLGRYGDNKRAIGILKANVAGNKLAVSGAQTAPFAFDGNMQVFDFNACTGEITNEQTVFLDNPYGVSFSPDGKLLYVSNQTQTEVQLLQYELEAVDSLNLADTKTIVWDTTIVQWGPRALQLAGNGKIYTSYLDNSYVGAINNPNISGLGCGFERQAVSLNYGTGLFGLPAFIENIFDPSVNLRPTVLSDFSYENVCVGSPTYFTNLSTFRPISIIVEGYEWYFDDVETGQDNFSIAENPSHTFMEPGEFAVQLIVKSSCIVDTVSKVVTIMAPDETLKKDTAVCRGDSIVLEAIEGADYLWQDGSTTRQYLVAEAGIYWVVIRSGLCTRVDSFSVAEKGVYPSVNFLNERIFCPNEALILDADNGLGATYLWQDGSTDTHYNVVTEGSYAVTVSNNCGVAIGESLLQYDLACCELSKPTAFSPNGDGVNEVFQVKSKNCAIAQWQLEVYNRWGQLVFQTTDATTAWEGQFKGGNCPIGTYAWLLKYEVQEQGKITALKSAGNVTLIR